MREIHSFVVVPLLTPPLPFAVTGILGSGLVVVLPAGGLGVGPVVAFGVGVFDVGVVAAAGGVNVLDGVLAVTVWGVRMIGGNRLACFSNWPNVSGCGVLIGVV
jgi:hypothetical protein